MPDMGEHTGDVELHTGAALESALAVLPDGVASQGTSVAVLRLPSDVDIESEPNALWHTEACVDGHLVVHIGHEDPATHTSVYDGSVTTSIPCSG
jgi:hypothetical protein